MPFCRSTVEIRAHICAEYGLGYSNSGCIKLLARLGFEYRKPKPLARVASCEAQAAFIALYERLMRELPADEAVYFADAVHPEYQTKPAFGWVKVGSNPAVLSTAGRGRVNIHVIWDNAAYHKGPDVRAFLGRLECRIHLIQLPPCCPQSLLPKSEAVRRCNPRVHAWNHPARMKKIPHHNPCEKFRVLV